MAMDVGGAKGGIKSDINVTPLVDVMLVLLIIMMIVAPLLQKGVDRAAARPRPTAPTSRKRRSRPSSSVTADGRFCVNGVPVPRAELRAPRGGHPREQDRNASSSSRPTRTPRTAR